MKQPKPRRRTGRKLVLGGLVVVAAAAVGVQALLPSGAVRDHLVEAVERQTGRTLAVGDLSLRIMPWPMFVAHNVVLSGAGLNPTPLFRAQEVRARIALLPLFARRIVLDDVAVLAPHVVLVRGTDGIANWQFVRAPAAPGTAQDAAPGPSDGAAHWQALLHAVRIEGADVQWDDATRRTHGHVTLAHAALGGLDGTTPTFDIQGRHDRGTFTLRGTSGDLRPVVWPTGALHAWPFHLTATLLPTGAGHSGDMVRADGTLDAATADNALRVTGYHISTSGTLDNLRDVESLFPRAGVPDVAAFGFDIAATDAGQGPRLDHLHLSSGAAHLTPQVALASGEIAADRATDPLGVHAQGTLYGPSLTVHGTIGTLAGAEQMWHAGMAAPTLSVVLDAADAQQTALHLQGVLGGDATAINLSGHTPHLDLVPGWALDDVVASAHLAGSSAQALSLSGVQVTSRQLAFGGSAAIAQGDPRPTLSAQIAVARADLDAMAVPVPPAPPPAHPAPAGAAAPAPVPRPDTPWTPWLHRMDTALDISVAHATAGGAAYDGLAAHLHTHGGDIPGGTLDLAPAMVPAPMVARWFGLEPWVDGPVQLVGHVSAQGTDQPALVQSLSGHLGVSMVGGTLDAARLRPMLGGPAGMLVGHGDLAIRCLGVHMGLADGHATLDTIGLDAGHLALSGQGTVGLADGALDLHLVPHIGLGGAGASTPVTVTGTIAAPQARMEATAQDGRFRVTIGGDAADADACPAMLATARENLPGPMPAAAAHHGGHHLSDMLRGLGLMR